MDAEEDDIEDDVGEAAHFPVSVVEAHNDEDGGNDDSKEVEESDVPIIGGIEFIVGVSTDFFILFVSSDAVIVLDNVKFDEILFETDVCDKSVGSVIK